MIRKSIIVALIAALVSLLTHFLGIWLVFRGTSHLPVAEGQTDTIELGNSFEDFAEPVSEPVKPEELPTSEPPEESTPIPAQPDIPTSEAKVASDNPQDGVSPDTGTAVDNPPTVSEPVRPDQATSGADIEQSTTPAVTPSNELQTPLGAPEVVTPSEPAETETDIPSPEQQTVAVQPSAQTPPVNDGSIPIAPLEPEAVDTNEVVAVEPSLSTDQEIDQNTESNEGTALAVTTSPRPRAPTRRSLPQPDGLFDGTTAFDALRYPEQAVESPLDAYRRKGVDVFASSNASGQTSLRGNGNSDTTNYAGKVLVHLNRAPTTYVPGSGFAQVFFEINPDGSLAWVEIIDSSGSPAIERAAKAQVHVAAPFPRPPGGKSRKMSFYYRIR